MKLKNKLWLNLACAVGLALLVSSCAATRPADPNAPAPRGEIPGYPVVLANVENRRDRAVAAWRSIANVSDGNAVVDPPLRPVTFTLASLPAAAPAIQLPRVGDPSRETMTAEETRESLRRFLADAEDLLGASSIQLSLVEVAERGAERVARYEQRPFLYPLRNNYGEVQVGFTPDRQVTQLSSSGIPVDEPLRRTVSRLTPRLRAEDVAARLVNRTVTLIGPEGAQTLIVTAADQVRPQELVIYPLLPPADPTQLELHLAWETRVKTEGSDAERVVYVDALTGEILTQPAASQISRAAR